MPKPITRGFGKKDAPSLYPDNPTWQPDMDPSPVILSAIHQDIYLDSPVTLTVDFVSPVHLEVSLKSIVKLEDGAG